MKKTDILACVGGHGLAPRFHGPDRRCRRSAGSQGPGDLSHDFAVRAQGRQYGNVRAKIENPGTLSASNVKVRFYLGSTLMGEKIVP